MKIITLANQKGGVAKTTTSSALAAGLTNRGSRVLAIDLDPQANFTLSCGVDILSLDNTLYDVFKQDCEAAKAVVNTPLGYDLLPGGLTLTSADTEFQQMGRYQMLSEALNEIKGSYDYIVIDTPPTLGVLTLNALTASDTLVIPMAADIYSVQGLSQLSGTIQGIYKYSNPNLKIAGILITKFNGRQNISKAILEQIEDAAETLGTKVFETRIRESVAVREAALLQSDLFKEAPKANATLDYDAFINEFVGGIE